MCTTPKVLMVLLSTRTNSAFEDNNLFSEQKAGFRRKEESIFQDSIVHETLRRRKISEQTTFAVLVDLKKACDAVLHGTLLKKINHIGARIRRLKLTLALRRLSTTCVRLGSGNLAHTSESFFLERCL